jgi:hypothetical protein
MTIFELCLAWNWEFDADFVNLLDTACQAHNLSLLQIRPDNLESLQNQLLTGVSSCLSFFDRASDEDDRFLPIVHWARQQEIFRINPYRQARRAWNKATMHYEFIQAGLHTPHTIVLPPYQLEPHLQPVELDPLGSSFAIKPAHGGGGQGVVTEATSWDQVQHARQVFPMDHYLLQAHVVPTNLGEHQAWFRVIYCAGEIYPSWWDPFTHVYTPVTFDERHMYKLDLLWQITSIIAITCQLDLFSTEIALTQYGQYKVIDYINDPIDLRLQSKTTQGVPNTIVEGIAQRLVSLVVENLPAVRS